MHICEEWVLSVPIYAKTKTFIHLIGQDKDKTIIHHSLNVVANQRLLRQISTIGDILFIIRNRMSINTMVV